jgi:hypothetical protein
MTGNETVNLCTFKHLNIEIKDMAKNSKIAGLVLGSIFAATALTAANDAMALDAGQCGTVVDISAALRAEGQMPIVTGFRSIPSRPRNVFTSNENLSLGYNIEGDGTQLCVRAKYTDIKLNNDANFARPSWAYIAPDNSPFNTFIEREEQRVNLKIIFGATALVKGQDGIERKGALLTVSKDRGDQYVDSRGAMVAANTNTGVYAVALDLENITTNGNYSKLASNGTSNTLLASVQSPK